MESVHRLVGWVGRAGKHAQGFKPEKRTGTRGGRPGFPCLSSTAGWLRSSVALQFAALSRRPPARGRKTLAAKAVGRFVEISCPFSGQPRPTDPRRMQRRPPLSIASVAWVDRARLAAWTGLAPVARPRPPNTEPFEWACVRRRVGEREPHHPFVFVGFLPRRPVPAAAKAAWGGAVDRQNSVPRFWAHQPSTPGDCARPIAPTCGSCAT